MKTWQCVLFSILVHGLIFALPVMTEIPPDNQTKEIQLLVLKPPADIIPEEKIPEPVAAPPIPPSPEVRPIAKKTPLPRKKPVQAPQPVSPPVTPVQPVTDSPAPNIPDAITDGPSPRETPPAADAWPTDLSAKGHAPQAAIHEAPAHQAAKPAAVSAVGAPGGPKFINRIMPRYPALARRLEKEGTVMLRLTIDESGKLTKVEVMEKAGSGFDEAAIEALNRSTFAPAIQNGMPVTCQAMLRISFQLSDD